MSPTRGAAQEHLLEIAYNSNPDLDDLVQSALFMTASRGSTSQDSDSRTVVSAWFETPDERDRARLAFEGLEVELRPIDRDPVNWLARYQQSLRAIEIGNRFVVAPDPALFPSDSNRLKIIVPQEQAFGTGSHETTALCLELLESTELRGARGLDVGSGSGILALGMIRLGAQRAIAFDNDPDAYGALRDNRIRNSVAPEALPIFIGSTESLRGGAFDVVTMNILPEVIEMLLPDVIARMTLLGRVIVSGVLVIRRDEVVNAARAHGLRVAEERSRGEWWAAALLKAEGLQLRAS